MFMLAKVRLDNVRYYVVKFTTSCDYRKSRRSNDIAVKELCHILYKDSKNTSVRDFQMRI